MKICMVTALDPSKTGIPKYTEGVVKGVLASDLPINLFLLVNKNAHRLQLLSSEARVIRCWERKITYPLQIISCVLKIRPRLVHVQHEFFLFGGPIEAAIFPVLMLIMRLSGFPVVLTLHGIPVFEYFNEDLKRFFFINRPTFSARFLLRPFMNIICRFSSLVIVHSEFAENILINYYGINERKVRVIPHGIDEFLWNGAVEDRSERDIIRILFFGFITPTKGIEDLVKAFALISNPNLKLIIAGGRHRRDDHYFYDILKLATADERITVVGYVPDALVSEYFLKSDFVVLPYHYQISSSGALAMAIAYEKPVIVTDTHYFSEIIKDGYNGLVIKAGDITGLKNAIEMLALNPILLRQLSQGCKETKSVLAWSGLVPKLWSIYTEASNSHDGAYKWVKGTSMIELYGSSDSHPFYDDMHHR